MAALRSFKRIGGPFRLLLLLLLQGLVEPTLPKIHGPKGKITAGSLATFKCFTGYFPSKDIKVVWMYDEKTIQSNKTSLFHKRVNGSDVYRLTCDVTIPLGLGDVRSELSCQIQHNSTQMAQKVPLGDFLRVPPKMRLETIPASPVQMDAPVMITCNAESFFPDGATVELFAEDAPSRRGTVAPRISNPDGTFSLKSYLEVTATEDQNSSMFLCQVQHDSQPPVNETTRLFIMKKSESSQKHSILVLCLGLFLAKVAIFLFITCLFLIKVRECKRTEDHSGTFQEVRLPGTSS